MNIMQIRIVLPFKHWFIILLCVTNTRILSVICQDEDLLWKCDNGECIHIEDVCDGKTDCSDGSDETSKNCIGTECRKINFVCTYGACVIGNADCNGEKECADGSDESPALCQKELWERQLQGRCRDQNMECKSGECISSEFMCDGYRHCRDGSDETLQVCSFHKICPDDMFRCGYGACVDKNLTCNDERDCADGSDESAIMCGRDKGRQCTSSIIATENTTVTNTKIITRFNSATCRIPYKGSDKLIVRNKLSNVTYRSGDDVMDGTPIKYECSKGNMIEGKANNVCITGEWQYQWPTCFRCCSDIHPRSGYSTSATFTLDGVDVNHLSCFKPNTIATFNCADGFIRPEGFIRTSTCQDGKWTRYKQRCNMKCGEGIPTFTMFSARGIDTNVTDNPWHVGIYVENEKSFRQVCIGTLISPRRVVTAAHCIFGDNEVDSPNKYSQNSPYWIATGKYYKEYNHVEYTQVTKRKVSSIWIPDDFEGTQTILRSDISILTLEDFVPLKNNVRPICVSYPDLAYQQVPPFKHGYFTTWNNIELGNLKSTLEKVPGTTLNFTVCKDRIFETFNYKIPGDKFCVKMLNSIRVCKGDSGSGFIIRNSENKRYELQGIVMT